MAGGDRLYVCGGYDGITSLSTVECYDPGMDRWVLVNGMTKQRSAAGISVLDGKIFGEYGLEVGGVCGGETRLSPHTLVWLNRGVFQ